MQRSDGRDLDRFYALLARLRAVPGQGRPLREYTGHDPRPARGVYFFEPGECRRDAPETPRVVRAGTHAVSAGSRSTLWGRLRAHRGTATGNGNHRGSIFRRHVGAALLARDGAALPSWGIGSHASKAFRQAEAEHERRVSAYIGAMPVVYVDVPDAAGPASMRAFLEQHAIALLSRNGDPVDPPSPAWVGRYSPPAEIRDSGLWNVNYVRFVYDPAFADAFEAAVDRTQGAAGSSLGGTAVVGRA